MKFIDYTGQKIGKWTVISVAEKGNQKGRNTFWNCICECGTHKVVFIASVKKHLNPGCRNCMRNRNNSARRNWRSMISRCANSTPGDKEYENYRGRGITVCERWRGNKGFANFLADIGQKPSEQHTIDRFPNRDGNYEPGNCRWATQTEQMRNTRRNKMIVIDGFVKCVSEWGEISGLIRQTIFLRLKNNWPPKLAVFTPAKHTNGITSVSVKRQLAEHEFDRLLSLGKIK